MNRQKDFPKSVQITPEISYAVKFKKGMNKKTGYDGWCHYDIKEIWISTGQTPELRLSTFCHELAHAASHEYGLDLEHKIVYDLEGPLAFFLSRNTKWLK